jgi:hypothetical protein
VVVDEGEYGWTVEGTTGDWLHWRGIIMKPMVMRPPEGEIKR